jgi:histone deacetylase 1/2
MSYPSAPFSPPPSSSASSSTRRVAYFYDPDVGNYVYYLGHPMKPHRIRMAHNLIVNYGLCDEDDPSYASEGARAINGVELSNGIKDPGTSVQGLDGNEGLSGSRGRGMQIFRPRRAGKGDMTRFHSDEYVDFLEKVTPETSEALTGGGVRCEWCLYIPTIVFGNHDCTNRGG